MITLTAIVAALALGAFTLRVWSLLARREKQAKQALHGKSA